jgi:mycothiol synthase
MTLRPTAFGLQTVAEEKRMGIEVDERRLPGLYMLWPGQLLATPPRTEVPGGYAVRTYTDGDESAFQALLASEDWAMSDRQWQEYRDRLLPNGLFLIVHTGSNTLVASAGAVHNPNPGRYYFPFGGELGDLIVHPGHRGRGLGHTAAALVVRRLLAAGYESIRVGVQGFRLPAIKTYLKLGFVPFLHHDDLLGRWQRICEQLDWPYTPGEWPKTLGENAGT